MRLDTSGNLTATGDVIAYSDERLKTNIETITGALDKVMSLRGVSYNRIDTEDKSRKIGVIAQETEKILPELITVSSDGILGVSYGNMSGVFIEAFKEQQKQIEELKSIVNNITK
jgi:chromosomal replication initiation ATPase DnaA